jgi:hypothetical protein
MLKRFFWWEKIRRNRGFYSHFDGRSMLIPHFAINILATIAFSPLLDPVFTQAMPPVWHRNAQLEDEKGWTF